MEAEFQEQVFEGSGSFLLKSFQAWTQKLAQHYFQHSLFIRAVRVLPPPDNRLLKEPVLIIACGHLYRTIILFCPLLCDFTEVLNLSEFPLHHAVVSVAVCQVFLFLSYSKLVAELHFLLYPLCLGGAINVTSFPSWFE